ncbi:hypothetical protein DSD19_03850 [Rhodovulum sp. BSW8]|uniref:phage protease n=1 Tax=Rhodovulum sp. BSW8 TaxID=2259645 RepID=UPI000DE2BA47|nr:hypothetical protein DSD19_03850 [Rhodovulum sp. BSW8]
MRAALEGRNAWRLERVTAKVEEAFQKGFLTTPMKAWARDLCVADEAAFDRFVASAAPAYAHLTSYAVTAAPPRKRVSAGASVSSEAADVARQLGLWPEALSD